MGFYMDQSCFSCVVINSLWNQTDGEQLFHYGAKRPDTNCRHVEKQPSENSVKFKDPVKTSVALKVWYCMLMFCTVHEFWFLITNIHFFLIPRNLNQSPFPPLSHVNLPMIYQISDFWNPFTNCYVCFPSKLEKSEFHCIILESCLQFVCYYYLLNNFPVTSAIFKSKLGGKACCNKTSWHETLSFMH